MKKTIIITLAAIAALICAGCGDNAVSNAQDQQADDFARRYSGSGGGVTTYTLTVNRNPTVGGTVTVNGVTYTNPTTHNANASVTVVATANSGYTFTGWSGDSTSTNASITVTMSTNRTVIANFAITTGSFTDSRDDRTYRTVMPDGKTWFAENLNYRNPDWSHNDVTGSVSVSTRGSWCHGNNSSNCGTYGRLYTWAAAMDNACPVGWRLPTLEDWRRLFRAVGGVNQGNWAYAGTALKSSPSDSPSWDGANRFGFSALPGGIGWVGSFSDLGAWGHWWSATEFDAGNAWYVGMGTGHSGVYERWSNKSGGLSVRCLKD